MSWFSKATVDFERINSGDFIKINVRNKNRNSAHQSLIGFFYFALPTQYHGKNDFHEIAPGNKYIINRYTAITATKRIKRKNMLQKVAAKVAQSCI